MLPGRCDGTAARGRRFCGGALRLIRRIFTAIAVVAQGVPVSLRLWLVSPVGAIFCYSNGSSFVLLKGRIVGGVVCYYRSGWLAVTTRGFIA